jgi:ABC-type protease/lipase transport system fused ATPase/permease subunit
MVTGLAAIMGLILVIVAKFFTTAQIQRIRRKVAEEQTTNSKIKTELRVAEVTKAVAFQNLKTEERIQRSLNLQIDKNNTDLANLKK